uniref:DUF1997 domain-containing protein n=2 Tax=Oryza TaxID=4527 RepID=A0A0D3FEA8_9ORYZ
MALLSVSSSHHAIHPGSSRSMQCICTRVTPSRSVGEISRSRSRNDLPLGVSPSSRMLTTCTLKTPSYGNKSKSKEKINPRDMFTFSYRFNTDIPMTETPGASIDEYLQNRPRIVGAVFPDKRKRTKLSDQQFLSGDHGFISARMISFFYFCEDKREFFFFLQEEWSVQLLPIQFLFLSASPVIVMRFVSKSGGKEYPPHVPVKATSLLLMEVTDYKLDGLDSNAMPSHLALTVRGSLYPRPEGRKSLRGHVEMSVGFNLPPVLALVPEGVIRGVGETVLRQLALQMKQDFDNGLAADFKRYRREKLTEKKTTP